MHLETDEAQRHFQGCIDRPGCYGEQRQFCASGPLRKELLACHLVGLTAYLGLARSLIRSKVEPALLKPPN